MPTIYVTARQLARRNNIHLRLILWTIVVEGSSVTPSPFTPPLLSLPSRKWVLSNLEDLRLGLDLGLRGDWRWNLLVFWELWIESKQEWRIWSRIISFIFYQSRKYVYFFENFESWILRAKFPIKRFLFYIYYKIVIMDYTV